jgi:lysophosphatidic acid acyltransferase/lysophosphatidylinositol acyltransferase
MLRYVPVVGWAWNFSDIVYLDRSWDKDRVVIAKGIRALADYPDPMLLLLFAEGTRFSPEKHKASLEFARERGLPQLKHHLIPRVKGFAETMRNLDTDKVKYIYDVTAAVDEKRGCPATLSNVLTGKKMVAELYIRRIPRTEVVGAKSEEDMSRFLMNLYSEKDALKDNYLSHGSFTRNGQDKRFEDFKAVEVLPRKYSLINMVVLNLLVGVPLVKMLVGVVLSGSLAQTLAVGTVSVALYVGLRKMIGLTKISKASAYGAKKEN